tara:strand:- start:1585 stop:1947 length:363 start_codon:yes stop_codon:yes gene_type:complete
METLYNRIGEERLTLLVDTFYEKIINHSSISSLFQSDIELVKEKQFMFLSQFLGGPQLYSEKYGHPKMRARHMSHKIDDTAKDEWLKCMKASIDTLDLETDLAEALYNCFPKVAQHMVNR